MSYRIRKLAELVHPGLIPADIGTDHGLLPILLVESGKAEKAYACDVAEGPLSQASANIRSHHLEGRIIPVLSDGFLAVPDDISCAVLAGMGTYTAIHILEEALPRVQRLSQVIVQVNDDLPLMRRWLDEHGFAILRELTLCDHGHFYTAIDTCWKPHSQYSERDILCGPMEAILDPEGWLAYACHELDRLAFVIERRGRDTELERQKELYQSAVDDMKKSRSI